MQENAPSRTAQRVALRRTAHQILDRPLVFEDPLALAMLGPRAAEELRADPDRGEASPAAPYLRAFLAARSRLAEDELALAVARGVSQYVILGAGLDTFAWRNPHPPGSLAVFEVDHPASQAFKRQRLAEAGLAPPPDLAFAPVDFLKVSLAEGLRRAGHDQGRASFFSWLGVTPYLTPEAVMDTLRFIAVSPAGGGVVFDFAVSPSRLDAPGRAAYQALAARAEAGGEPWLAHFEPAALAVELRAMGFAEVTRLGRAEINARYFAGRADGLGVGSMYQLISARV